MPLQRFSSPLERAAQTDEKKLLAAYLQKKKGAAVSKFESMALMIIKMFGRSLWSAFEKEH